MGIASLSTWTEKTVGCVRSACAKRESPCVAMCLVFYDPFAKEDERWEFSINLAMDPHSILEKKDRECLVTALEYVAAGIKKIMEDPALAEEAKTKEIKREDVIIGGKRVN